MSPKLPVAAILILGWAQGAGAARPQPRTLAAFRAYIERVESRTEQQEQSPNSFLTVGTAPLTGNAPLEARLRRGYVFVESCCDSPRAVPGGLIDDWTGLMFIPRATIPQLFRVLRDYDHWPSYYHPEITRSRLLARHGEDYCIWMRMREHYLITVVLDAEYDVHYGQLDRWHQSSFSRSTRITEIADAGERDEHALNGRAAHGFLWRLNAYWRFEEVTDGVFVECEAVSLTRNVPRGLAWLIDPWIRKIPREALRFTLEATRHAVRRATEADGPPSSQQGRAP